MHHDCSLRRASASIRGLPLWHGFYAASVAAILLASAHAQEVALPSPSPSDIGIPPEQPGASPAPTIPPPQIIPPDVLPMPDATGLPGAPAQRGATLKELDEELKAKPLSQASENYRLLIEWRKLRNQVQNDPVVKAAFAATDRAPTDLERRKLFARYFDILFDKMVAARPDMKAYLNDRRREHMNALPQPRVRPMPTPTRTAAKRR